MSMVTGGFKCDVCGKMIFLMHRELLRPMRIKGIDRLLHVHGPMSEHDCYNQVTLAMKMKDYRLLPYGPLKELYHQEIRKERADIANDN